MEGKAIKEELVGSPCSPPTSGTQNNNAVINTSIAITPNNTNTSTPTPNGAAPSGKENRRLVSPLTTSDILTRSRSKGLPKENCHHSSHHHHHHHHHRLIESPKVTPHGTIPGSSSQHSPPPPSTLMPSVKAGSHLPSQQTPQAFGHPFSSPHSTTNTTSSTIGGTGLPNGTGSTGRVISPSSSPTESTTNGTSHNSGRTPSSSSSNSNSTSSRTSHLSSTTSSGNTGKLILKIKRFLGTLLHFGCDISTDVGERVRSLVFNLVSGHLSIEDFHHSLQEVTSFPLRPFVVPFLKAHLPLLQREITHLARVSKQSTLSFVRSHEQVIVESGATPGEPCDIFHSEAGDPSLPGKRKSESLYENGDGNDTSPYTSTPKRFNGGLFSPPFFLSNLSGTGSGSGGGISTSSSELRDYYSAAGYHLLSSQLHSLQQDPTSAPPTPQSTTTPIPTTNGLSNSAKGPEDEWRNIHVMLNCILSMVEKTKRALSILQTRTFHNELESNSGGGSSSSSASSSWLRRPSGGFGSVDSSDDFKRHAGEMMAQALRATEDRVAEVKRRAEDAVLEVKRQALVELQRAVAAAEARACEAVATERARLERVFLDSRRNGGDNVNIGAVPTDPETCWNCGRKAHETCSGCNMARYCGAFCQHKDWEHHHNVCGRSHSTSSDREREPRPVTNVSNVETKNAHIQDNSNSPINVSHPSPDNRSSGSN